jgi:single-strand DNA-binding protein
MNKVLLIGRTTKDIELRTTNSGKSVISFSIAVNRTFKNENGEYDSDFFNCIAFNKLAETVSRYVGKGDLLAVEGRLQTRNYTDTNGSKHYVTEILVDSVDFLQPKKKEETAPYKEKVEFEEADPFADFPL